MNQRARNFVIFLLRGYKWALSPFLLPSCRYVPTCSEYAMEAVDRYGVMRGSLMAMWRVCRCHPFVQGGYDPVAKSPETGSTSKFKDYGVTNAPPASCAVTE
jgi:putative membrane protein insertion efficiency factor